MIRSELIQKIAEENPHLFQRDVERIVNTIFEEIIEAIAAQVCVETLEAGYAALGEFHYLHHDPSGRPYSDPARMAGAVAAGTHRRRVLLLGLAYKKATSDWRESPSVVVAERLAASGA